MSITASDNTRETWRSAHRMGRVFDRILRSDGWAWPGLRPAPWYGECGREIFTSP